MIHVLGQIKLNIIIFLKKKIFSHFKYYEKVM